MTTKWDVAAPRDKGLVYWHPTGWSDRPGKPRTHSDAKLISEQMRADKVYGRPQPRPR